MNTIKTLIEDYQRRLKTVNDMLKDGDIDDITSERLVTKAGNFRTFIAELEKTVVDDNDCKTIVEVIDLIPQQRQVHYDTAKQLRELRYAANRLGLYDAADYLRPK